VFEREAADPNIRPLTEEPDLSSPRLLGWLNGSDDSSPKRVWVDVLRQHAAGQYDQQGVATLFLLDEPLLGTDRL
jgi:hypothetical protein